jgi:hypothetical protein
MTVDADVQRVAKQWGLDPKLLQAVVDAEGNIVTAVKCSIPSVKTRAQALTILARSCTHALNDYVRATNPEGFVAFWGQRWAPVGATNDPRQLNAFWPKNVLTLWLSTRHV